MNYGRYNGMPVSRADAHELGLVSTCDNCGEEFEAEHLQQIGDYEYCAACAEDQ